MSIQSNGHRDFTALLGIHVAAQQWRRQRCNSVNAVTSRTHGASSQGWPRLSISEIACNFATSDALLCKLYVVSGAARTRCCIHLVSLEDGLEMCVLMRLDIARWSKVFGCALMRATCASPNVILSTLPACFANGQACARPAAECACVRSKHEIPSGQLTAVACMSNATPITFCTSQILHEIRYCLTCTCYRDYWSRRGLSERSL